MVNYLRVESMQQLETPKQLYQPQQPIPKPDKPIPLRKMLNSEDMQYIETKRFYWISIKVYGETVFARIEQTIPQECTTINRNEQGQLIGFPLVVGG